MHALLEEIEGLLAKIKAGTASLGELEAFAAATQQLNERAIILKYKAYEAKVYGTSAPFDSAQRESLEDRNSASVDEHSSASGDLETKSEETEKTEESSVPSHIGKAIPEPIIEPDDADEELSFDLFSMDSEEVGFENLSQHENLSQQESSNHPKEDEIETVQESAPEPVIEEPIAAPVIEEKESEIVDEPAAIAAPEITETPKIEPTPVSPAPTNEHPVLRRARTNDGSLQSRLLSVRLETLKNAFGLNERILIVKELFGGDNELYNSTIDTLDSAADINAARTKMNALANQYGWREDSELAIEFVQKVERRYA